MTEKTIDIAVEEYDDIVRVKPMSVSAKIWFDAHVRPMDPTLTINGWIPMDKGPATVTMIDEAMKSGLLMVPVTPLFFHYAWNLSVAKPTFV